MVTDTRRDIISRETVQGLVMVDRPRGHGGFIHNRLSGPPRLSGNRSQFPSNDQRTDIHDYLAGSFAFLPVSIGGGELHLDSRDATVFFTLEVREVPAGCHEIGPHPLDSMHEHSGTSERGCLAILDYNA
jgi:hypothetical protein